MIEDFKKNNIDADPYLHEYIDMSKEKMDASYKLLLEESRQENSKNHTKQRREHVAQYKPQTKQFKQISLQESHAAEQVCKGIFAVNKLLVQPLDDNNKVYLLDCFLSQTMFSWDVKQARKAQVLRRLMKHNKLQMLTACGYWLQGLNTNRLRAMFSSKV